MKKRSVVFVLIDGLADVSLQELDQKTPLEAAQTPAMDAIAHGGLTGLMDPVEPGYACGSDTAHMSIMGYNPIVHYRGRGSFEAMGAGLPMSKGDVAYKCNFATVEKNEDGQLIVERRRVGRNFPAWGIELCSFLNGLTLPEFHGLVVAAGEPTSVDSPSIGPLTDGVARFSELAVARGALGRFAGDQVMTLVKGFREYEL